MAKVRKSTRSRKPSDRSSSDRSSTSTASVSAPGAATRRKASRAAGSTKAAKSRQMVATRQSASGLPQAEGVVHGADPLLATLDLLPIAVAISTMPDGVIVFANRHLCEALGWPCEELVGKASRPFYEDLADRKKLMARLQAEGAVRDMELSIRRRDGARLIVTLSVQPIQFRGQNCLLSAMNDVSERVRTERLLQNERTLLNRILQVHERDRQLIGFELHDGLVQDLTGASLFLQAGIAELDDVRATVPDSLRTADRTLQLAIAEARRLISGLQPPILAEAGLIAALETLVRRLSEDNAIKIQFTHSMKGMRVFPDLEMAVYRIIQEALNNAMQHSQAKNVTVNLKQRGQRVLAVVKDDGVGFDTAQVTRKRYGLVGMRERARLLGGVAEIDSVPGKGTRVTVDLPIEDAKL